jgi:rhodanese-related sulfurtransferase
MTTLCKESSSRRAAIHRALLAAILVIAAGLGGSLATSAAGDDRSAPELATIGLPAGKQTTLGLYVTARQAYEQWQAAPDKVVILDVRTPEEYMFVGHADMAWNIPVAAQLYQWDAENRKFPMRLLPDFVSRVKQVAKPDDTLLVMCRSGGRSAMAVNQLAAAGFRNVYNITDGMEGDPVTEPGSVFHGQRLVNGWKNSGLPWTYDVDPARMLLPPVQ